MDGRRARWIAWDVEFFGKRTGSEMMKRFGPAGVTVWLAFLLACKRNRIQGQISYMNEADCLAQLGLVGIHLVDNEQRPFTLDDLWTWLGQRHHTRRRRVSGELTTILSRGWDDWQTSPQRHDDEPQTRRSDRRNTARMETIADADSDSDSDSDITPLTPQGGDESCPHQCRDGWVFDGTTDETSASSVVSPCPIHRSEQWKVVNE